ncbi:hypothetical protein Dip510_001517 [Elusimicrobium posterum]|uniref:hypothetical protein n=1 Tax=Elusimicrobium posterum TaxID=3116653 RepID=UPI003C790920
MIKKWVFNVLTGCKHDYNLKGHHLMSIKKKKDEEPQSEGKAAKSVINFLIKDGWQVLGFLNGGKKQVK